MLLGSSWPCPMCPTCPMGCAPPQQPLLLSLKGVALCTGARQGKGREGLQVSPAPGSISHPPLAHMCPASHRCCPQPHKCQCHGVRRCFRGDAVQQVGVPQLPPGAVPSLSDIFRATCGLMGDIKQSQLLPTSQVLQRGHILGTFPAFPMGSRPDVMQ